MDVRRPLAAALIASLGLGVLALFLCDVRPRLQRHRALDRELERRVRTELGRWVSYPHAIDIRVRDGVVLLGGSVLAAEQAQLQRVVEGVPGVQRVQARVAAYDSPAALPGQPS